MDEKRIVSLFDGIDDDIICQANKDINLWLGSRDGISVRAAPKPLRSPWKAAVASVACAVAAVGVFALVSNIDKLKGINNSVYNGNSGDNTASNSDPADYVIDNLDFENAVIIENAPNSGQWQKVSVEYDVLDETAPDRLVELAALYGVAADKSDFLLTLRNVTGSVADYRVPYTKLEEPVLAKYKNYMKDDPDRFPYWKLYYLGDVYAELNFIGGGMIEFDNRKNINSIFGEGYLASDFSWRPVVGSKSKSIINLDDENATCILDGKTVKISDAVQNAKSFILENNILLPGNFGLELREGVVHTYENGNQALSLDFEYTLDGVTFTMPPSVIFAGEAKNKYAADPVKLQCGMLTENTVDWLCLAPIDPLTEFRSEECELKVSMDEACKLASQKLDHEGAYDVEEIRLMYTAELEENGTHADIEPKWRIKVSDYRNSERIMMFVYVSAVDGDMYIHRWTP